jgi:hypothetical protein
MSLYKTYNKSIKALTLYTPLGCMSECPCFYMRVEASGALEYHGIANMPKIGDHKGCVNPLSFDALAGVVETSGFLQLSESPEPSESCFSTIGTVTIGVELMDGQTLSFWRDALGVLPPLIWAVEKLMIGLLEDAEWGDDVHARAIMGPLPEEEPVWAIQKDIDFDRRKMPNSAKKVYLKAKAVRPPEPRENNIWIAYRFSTTSYIEYSRSTREYTLYSDGTVLVSSDFAVLVDQITDNK